MQSSAPGDGRKHRPKHVEPTWNNKLICIVYLVGYIHRLVHFVYKMLRPVKWYFKKFQWRWNVVVEKVAPWWAQICTVLIPRQHGNIQTLPECGNTYKFRNVRRKRSFAQLVTAISLTALTFSQEKKLRYVSKNVVSFLVKLLWNCVTFNCVSVALSVLCIVICAIDIE